MHPIERLRYVARASHIPADVMARETAIALVSFTDDEAGFLIACRRILDRQPTAAPLVWLAAHGLGAPDPRVALWDAVETLEDDQTDAALAFSLPDDAVVATVGWSEAISTLARKRGDVRFVLIDPDGSAEYQIDRLIDAGTDATVVDPEATAQAIFQATHLIVPFDAFGPEQGLAALGTFAAAAVAKHIEVPVWGVAPIGVALNDRMYQGLIKRWDAQTTDPRHLRLVEEVPVALIDEVVTTAGAVSPDQAIRGSACPIVPELY